MFKLKYAVSYSIGGMTRENRETVVVWDGPRNPEIRDAMIEAALSDIHSRRPVIINKFKVIGVVFHPPKWLKNIIDNFRND